MSQEKYIGMDVHAATISAAVMNTQGKLLMECVLETKAATILEFIQGLRGTLAVTFEEGTSAAWLHDLLKPHVSRLVVCDPRKNALLRDGNQNDRVDARNLAEMLRTKQVHAVYHGKQGIRALRELGRSYLALTQDSTRVMNRIKSVYRSWAIPCGGSSVYSRRHRAEWLAKLVEPGVRIRAEHLYQQLDSSRTRASSSPTRAVAGKSQACGGEIAASDSCHRSDSLRPAGGLTADTPSLPYQAPALGLQRVCRPDV